MRFRLTSVTQADVAALRSDLTGWQPPAEFRGKVLRFRERVTRGEFFNVPALGFLRDAWTLGKFGELADAEHVRLSADSFPDGHAKLGTRVLDIEITEAIMPDRRRGQEFLPGTPQAVEDPGHEWDRRIDALPEVLRQTIERKVSKAYATRPSLVVYLNITAYRHREDECLKAIARHIEHHRPSFAGLYVIWQDQLYGG